MSWYNHREGLSISFKDNLYVWIVSYEYCFCIWNYAFIIIIAYVFLHISIVTIMYVKVPGYWFRPGPKKLRAGPADAAIYT
jgi:hypothetical protein